MATIFSEIVSKRKEKDSNKVDFRPLWKLKVSDAEFEELRKSLYYKAIGSYSDNRFDSCKDDCMLYFAMYWQRIFSGGNPNKEDVAKSLGKNVSDEVTEMFYKAARDAFQNRGMPVFQETNTMWFRCMLYQGGLPLNAICGSENNAWKNFAEKLVKGEINLENPDLNLGSTAENYKPLRQFAEHLYNGLISSNLSLMPFWCNNKDNSWYQGLDNLRKEIIKKERDVNPFSIVQAIAIDEVSKRIYPAFQVLAPKILPKQYDNRETIELKIELNGMLKHSQTYVDRFYRNEVKKNIPINAPNDVLSLSLNNDLVDEKEFDLSEPVFFYYNGNNRRGFLTFNRTNSFRQGIRKFGIIPEEYEIEDECIKIEEYSWDSKIIRIVDIPADRKEKIVLISKENQSQIIFGKDNPSFDSIIRYTPVLSDYVGSPVLFNSRNDTKGYVIIEDGEDQIKDFGRVLYSKDKKEWTNIAPYGKIYAKVEMASGQVVSVKTLYNVGDDLKIEVISSTPEKCNIKIEWKEGQVTCIEDGAFLNKDNFNSWEISKKSLKSPLGIRFNLTPLDGNMFQIFLRPAFRQISIFDEEGNEINKKSFIPFTDYDLYRYNIYGYSQTRLKVGEETYKLTSLNSGIRKRLGDLTTEIPYSGSLARLIGSREEISLKFDEQGKDIVYTQLNIDLGENDLKYNLHIKENPYIIKFDVESSTLTLHNPDHTERPFKHRLYAFKLKDPSEEPVILIPNEDKKVILPENLREVANLLIVGKTPGRIIPRLINQPYTLKVGCKKSPCSANHMDTIMEDSSAPKENGSYNVKVSKDNKDKRKETKNFIGSRLDKEYLNSDVWIDVTNWFFTCSEYGLPYTTLIQIEAVSEKSTRLIKFLFSCLLSERLDQNTFIFNLQQMARDCTFKWLWLIPYLKMNLLMGVIETSYNMQELPEGITFDLLSIKTQELHHLISQLIDDSIKESSVKIYNEFIERTKNLFEPSSVNDYQPHYKEREFLNLGSIKIYTDDNSEFAEVMDNLTVNEKWVESRAKYFAQYLLNPIENDIFGISLEAKKSLRLLYKQAPMIFLKRTFIQLQKLSK